MVDSSKRKLLQSAAALLICSGVAPAVIFEVTMPSTMDRARIRLLSLLNDHHAATEIGKVVIQSGQLSASGSDLVRNILTQLKLSADQVITMHPQNLAETYFTRVLLDFDNGDTLTVSGWVLSRTEALLSAVKTFN